MWVGIRIPLTVYVSISRCRVYPTRSQYPVEGIRIRSRSVWLYHVLMVWMIGRTEDTLWVGIRLCTNMHLYLST